MLPPATIRNFQIDQLRKDLKIINSILSRTSPEEINTYRDGGEGWTVLQVLCHLCDYEDIYFTRAGMTVEQDMPELPNPNPNELAIEHQYSRQDLQATYQKWVERRNEYLAFLDGLDESAWQKSAKHPVRGVMSVEDQVALTVWHDTNHIEQITRILAERK
jgi:uncharacterized damage-inducible protein DinB